MDIKCDCGGVKCKVPCVDWCSTRQLSVNGYGSIDEPKIVTGSKAVLKLNGQPLALISSVSYSIKPVAPPFEIIYKQCAYFIGLHLVYVCTLKGYEKSFIPIKIPIAAMLIGSPPALMEDRIKLAVATELNTLPTNNPWPRPISGWTVSDFDKATDLGMYDNTADTKGSVEHPFQPGLRVYVQGTIPTKAGTP